MSGQAAYFGNNPPACCQPNFGCNTRPPIGASGIMGYPNVTSYVGQLVTSLDGQYSNCLYAGLMVFTKISGFFQKWVVTNTGPAQATTQDADGNYVIVRFIDTGVTGLALVALN